MVGEQKLKCQFGLQKQKELQVSTVEIITLTCRDKIDEPEGKDSRYTVSSMQSKTWTAGVTGQGKRSKRFHTLASKVGTGERHQVAECNVDGKPWAAGRRCLRHFVGG